MARDLRTLVRWPEWYASKLPTYLAGIAYAALRTDAGNVWHLAEMALLFALLCLYAAFGHVLNDYSDLEADRAAGKVRVLASWRRSSAAALLLGLAMAIFGIAAACFDGATIALVTAAILLAAAYSLPPLRLKERASLAWIGATLAQRTLPMAIIFEAMGVWDVAAVALTALGSVVGVRYIIVHQLADRRNDLRAGVRTAATAGDPDRLVRLLTRWLFPLEIACAAIAVLAIAVHLPMMAVVSAGYVAWLLVADRRDVPLSPTSYSLFREFHGMILPVTLAAILAGGSVLFLPVLALALALAHDRLSLIASALRPPESTKARRTGAQPPPVADRAPSPSPPAVAPERPPALTRADPYPRYAWMRERAAVHSLDWTDIGPGRFVVRHAEAAIVFKDARFLKRDPARTAPDAIDAGARGFGHDMLDSDPPDHTRLRKLVGRAFTSSMVEGLEGRIRQLADEILDRAGQRGEIELVSEYAAVIPIRVITALLGLHVPDIDRFRRFVEEMSLKPSLGQDSDALRAAKARFTRHLEEVFAARRREPRDDLITALVQAEQDGDRLSATELVSMVHLLLLAGFVTTTSLIANGTLALLRNPDQLDRLRGDPALTPQAIEELLRYDSPLELSTPHYASTDIALGGATIPRGAAVRVVIPAVNRDPAVFARPDVLDLGRRPCPHLAFGQGIHFCVGAPLARLEGRIALRTLIDRAPALRLADPGRITWLQHPVLRGVRRLPLRL